MNYPDLDADFSARDANDGVMELQKQRWSPRAFKKHPIGDDDINTIFDAARWAPSCFNEQPWRFYLSTDASFNAFLQLLVPGNQQWAQNASLLGFISCTKTFAMNGNDNAHNRFDTGAAWMAMTLQARSMGLYTHGMGGILFDEAKEYLKLPDDEDLVCGFALGVIDHADGLPDPLKEKELPTPRKSLDSILIRK